MIIEKGEKVQITLLEPSAAQYTDEWLEMLQPWLQQLRSHDGGYLNKRFCSTTRVT